MVLFMYDGQTLKEHNEQDAENIYQFHDWHLCKLEMSGFDLFT